MTRTCTPNIVLSLAPNEVFVFGTNAQGFHGAGQAGVAFRGTADNTWRSDEGFLAAMASPEGSPERIGRWAIFGVSRGLMEGRDGKSYGIETVTRPGAKRSVSKASIRVQIADLFAFATAHSELRFLVARLGCGYGGYSESEMRAIFREADAEEKIPENVLLPAAFEFRNDPSALAPGKG